MKPSDRDRQNCSTWKKLWLISLSIVIRSSDCLIVYHLLEHKRAGMCWSLEYQHHQLELESSERRWKKEVQSFIFSKSNTSLLSGMWRCSSERKWSLLAALATLFSVVSSECSTSWMTTSMCETKLESSQVTLTMNVSSARCSPLLSIHKHVSSMWRLRPNGRTLINTYPLNDCMQILIQPSSTHILTGNHACS